MRPVQHPAPAMDFDALRLEWRLRLMEQRSPAEPGDCLGLRQRIAEVESEIIRRCWEATR